MLLTAANPPTTARRWLSVRAYWRSLPLRASLLPTTRRRRIAEDEQRRDYDEGRGQALDDMDYLKRECAREVRFHLERDHGDVRDLDLRYPNLNGRTLTGQGRVSFDRGGHRDLTYTCDFDRRGRIHDGHYSYRSAW